MIRIVYFVVFSLFALTLVSSCRKKLSAETIRLNATIETDPPVIAPHVKKVGNMIGGYYSILPALYPGTSKNYPLIVSLHGGGQVGNGNSDLDFLLNDGIPLLAKQNKFPANFSVGGNNFSFVVLAPQFNTYPSDAEVAAFIDFARKEYRIDPSRIYMTGLSLGGIVTSDMGGQYTSRLAAIVPMSGVSIDNFLDQRGKSIANGKLPVWIFHNQDDPKISVADPLNFVAAINKYSPSVVPKLTLFPGNTHDSWSKALDPGFREGGMNIYEWMLQYKR